MSAPNASPTKIPTDITTRLTVRRSIHIAAPPERVWLEFTTRERFAAWFGVLREETAADGQRRTMGHTVVTYEPRAGGWIELEVEVDGVQRRFGGKITVFDPPHELTFEDEWLPSDGTPPLLITLRLTAAPAGTMVELIQYGFEALGAAGPETHRGHESGWTLRQLDALRQIVERA